ncbi:hypothetical protein [Deinococcus aestuarii]|uniref:hypothetical protein n=1 Tax=Deinococcus aestuarii TaxID=2774531 RepID=UPI001C0BCDA2|nr:hypothetical protein [Deinococcus aestuarii]
MSKPLLLAALLAATSLPVQAQSTQPTPEQAAQLIDRLFRTMYGPGGNVQLLYGTLPATLPLQLDPRLTVLASVRTSAQGGQFVQHRILLSTALSPDEARAALQTSLEGTGWKARPNDGQPIGFATQQTVRSTSFYREGATNFLLGVGVVDRGGRTELDLNVNVVSDQQLASFKQAARYQPRSSLPLLKAFPGATIKGAYPGGVPNGALSSAHVQTNRSANEVFAFYSAQLKAAGWKVRTDTTDGPLRVVTYSLKDLNGREALGTLGIRPWEKDGGYVLTVSVQGFKP